MPIPDNMRACRRCGTRIPTFQTVCRNCGSLNVGLSYKMRTVYTQMRYSFVLTDDDRRYLAEQERRRQEYIDAMNIKPRMFRPRV